MHMCITVSGRQRRLSHGPPDSSIPCDAGATTRSRIRVGTGKAALHRNAGLPCTGGWIEDTRPVRRRFLSIFRQAQGRDPRLAFPRGLHVRSTARGNGRT